MPRYTIRKHLGDDVYSWALFDNGRPILTGQSRSEAQYERDQLRRTEKAKKAQQPVDDDQLPTTAEGWIARIDLAVKETVDDRAGDEGYEVTADEIYADMVAAILIECPDRTMAHEVCRRTLGYTPLDVERHHGALA